MERLTEWRGEHAAVVNHHVNYIDRLAAYEDIGLTPKEIVATLINYISFLSEMTGGRMSKTNYTVKAMISAANDHFQSICDECREDKHATELLDAEAEGRLVVLPCKVGDTVWKISRAYKVVSMYTIAGFLHDGMRWKLRMVKTIPSWVGNKTEHKYVSFASFGKTVFLTREEAEAALKGDSNG